MGTYAGLIVAVTIMKKNGLKRTPMSNSMTVTLATSSTLAWQLCGCELRLMQDIVGCIIFDIKVRKTADVDSRFRMEAK